MDLELEGKTAIVTGGSRGIGKAIARELALSGCDVVICARNAEALSLTARELSEEMGRKVVGIPADTGSTEDVERMVKAAAQDLGHIDILVNNAGITRDRTFNKMSFEEWHEVINTNLSSVFNTCKIALPAMLEQKYGRIVNISSVIGQAGGFGQTNYASAKAGMIGFTKSLALETARKGVTVNAICPGFIGTEMVCDLPVNCQETIIAQIPMKKLGEPADVARGVVFICESDYMTGQCLNLNGGLYMM